MTRRVVALVSGHVQGVGYRWFVRGLAAAAGLAGSARNLPDGRVEVVLEGAGRRRRRGARRARRSARPGAVTGVDSPGRTGAGELRVHHRVTNATSPRHGE